MIEYVSLVFGQVLRRLEILNPFWLIVEIHTPFRLTRVTNGVYGLPTFRPRRVRKIIWFLKFAAAYAAPFVLAAIMPGWRTLTAFGVLVGLPVAGGFIYLIQHDFRSDVLAEVYSKGFYGFACVGVIAGLATRAQSLKQREEGSSRSRRVALTLIGFLIVPSLIALYAGLQYWNSWSRRPPPQACLDSVFQIAIAEATYSLPAAPLFTVFTSGDNAVYNFDTNRGLREFCAESRYSRTPVRTRLLMVSFRSFSWSRSTALRERFCRAPASAWRQELCRRNIDWDALSYPVEASVYSLDEFDARFRYSSGRTSHAEFLVERTRRQSDGTTLMPERFGNFERYANRYWVARGESWTTESGDPYTLRCSERTPAGTLSCWTAYRLRGAVHVSYDFRAPVDNLEATARVVDRNLRALLSELSGTD